MINEEFAIDEGLYSSNKDIGVEPAGIAEPVFEPSPEFTIDVAPVTASPDRSGSSDLTSAKTIIPTTLTYVPDITQFPEQEILKVDTEKMAAKFPEEIAARIIDNIQNNIPVPEEIAEKLITKKIITPVYPSEITPPAVEIIQNTAIETETPKPVKTVKKISFIDNLVNKVYNLIFK
jgi:hypothetical protein